MVIGHQKHYLDPTLSPPNLQSHILDRAFGILNTKNTTMALHLENHSKIEMSRRETNNYHYLYCKKGHSNNGT